MLFVRVLFFKVLAMKLHHMIIGDHVEVKESLYASMTLFSWTKYDAKFLN